MKAFPNDQLNGGKDGMDLRDYFAAKAMQALLPMWEENPTYDLCKRAYNTADAMMKAREVK